MSVTGREIMVFAACLNNPAFTQTKPNTTELCSDRLMHKSVCNIGVEAEHDLVGCFCHFDSATSFFVIPICVWKNVDTNGDVLTTTELVTTEFPTTTSILTYPEETTWSTTLAPVTNGEIDCNASNFLPRGKLLCDGALCQIYCDPGFAPKQLVSSTAVVPATSRSKIRNLEKSELKPKNCIILILIGFQGTEHGAVSHATF